MTASKSINGDVKASTGIVKHDKRAENGANLFKMHTF